MDLLFEWPLVDRELGSLLLVKPRQNITVTLLLREIKEAQAGWNSGKWRSWACSKYAAWTDSSSPSITVLESSIHPALRAQIVPLHKRLTLLPFILSISFHISLMEAVLNLFLKPTWLLPPKGEFNFSLIAIIDLLILLSQLLLDLHFLFLIPFFAFVFVFCDTGYVYFMFSSATWEVYILYIILLVVTISFLNIYLKEHFLLR